MEAQRFYLIVKSLLPSHITFELTVYNFYFIRILQKHVRTLSTSETQENSADKDQNMINTGTLDIDWSQPVIFKPKQNEPNFNCSDFDWSRPVSTKLGGSGTDDSDSNFEWSKPVSTKLGGSGADDSDSNFDWSKPVSTEIGVSGSSSDIDCSQPVPSKSETNGSPDDFSSGGLNEESSKCEYPKPPASDCEERSEPAISEDNCTEAISQNADAVSQRLKFKACLKLVVEELCTLPYHCQIHNKDLRSTFNAWLKKELDLIHRICGYEGDKSDSLVPLKVSTPTSLEAGKVQLLSHKCLLHYSSPVCFFFGVANWH